MIVAVTGANGFIGRRLCERLSSEGYEVRPVVRADFERGGLLALLNGADVVVHAAAATRARTRVEFWRSNVALTKQVCDAAKIANVGNVVFVSSQAVSGPAAALDQPTRESDPEAPIEEYGRTKLEAERVVRKSGLRFTIVRPASVYGPGDRDFAVLFRLARHGIAVHPGNRDHWISILHVDDCIDGILKAIVRDQAGETFFLANDEPVRWSTVYELAAAAHGGRLRIDVEVPALVMTLAAKIGDAAARLTGRVGLLTSEKVALSRPRFWVCSNDRARSDLGFLPGINLPDGIADAISRLG